MRLNYLPPRHKTEADAAVQHRKTPADQLEGLTVNAAETLAVLHLVPSLSDLSLQILSHQGDFALTQSRQQVAGEANTLAPAVDQPLLNQKLLAPDHGRPNLRAEALPSELMASSIASNQGAVQPRRAHSLDLLFDG